MGACVGPRGRHAEVVDVTGKDAAMLRAAALAAISLLTVLVVACGGGGGAADADPATAVPRDALVYVEVAVRPDGDVREDALAAAGKILRTPDPEAKIREVLDRALAEGDSGINYDRDIAPWLGERAGLWVSNRIDEEGDPGVALAVASTDTEEAEGSIDEAIRRESPRVSERSHADVSYKVDPDGFAYGVAEDFALFGDEPELKRMVDVLQGESLAEDDRYRNAVGGLEDARLAHFFFELRRFFDLAARQDPEGAESLRQLEAFIPFDRLPPVAGAFIADGERLALDFVAPIPRGNVRESLGALAWGNGSTPLMGELPADSWYAQGNPQFGETARAVFGQFAGALGGAVVQEQVRRELGIDLEQDVFSWMGDLALFARGETADTIDGGAVIEVTDEGRATSAFGKIVGALRTRGQVDPRPVRIDGAETAFAVSVPGAPRPVVLARGEERVAVTYGEQAAAAALSPDETLGDSELFDDAESVLGGDLDPSLIVSVPPIVSLVESFGTAGPEWDQARPYIETFTLLAFGSGSDGNRVRVRFATGLE
jgi:uncharacterized protein DUF3352